MTKKELVEALATFSDNEIVYVEFADLGEGGPVNVNSHIIKVVYDKVEDEDGLSVILVTDHAV